MRVLRITSTLTDDKERFAPRTPGRVKFFSCGPSVYRRQHLGNYRTYLLADLLQKYLEYRGLRVERVINFTDVEDKAIAEARDKGVSLEALRAPVEAAFFDEAERLGIRLPETIPRATTSVDAAVELIQRLLARGHAYWHQGEVFYDPLTYPGFGRLYGLDMERWPSRKIRFRKDTYPGQRWNRGDFILWHKRRPADGDVWWESAIGPGRPAWNIQDAAMIYRHLGFEIDLHTGGVDNLYRHHDYTLAIMEGASGKTFCPRWLHGGHLLVEGRKMSKSRGNVTLVSDLLDLGFRPRQIRFFLLYAPYRGPLDLHIGALERSAGRLERARHLAGEVFAGGRTAEKRSGPDIAAAMRADFEARMNDDLDVAGAFDALVAHLSKAATAARGGGLSRRRREAVAGTLQRVDQVLGVFGRGQCRE